MCDYIEKRLIHVSKKVADAKSCKEKWCTSTQAGHSEDGCDVARCSTVIREIQKHEGNWRLISGMFWLVTVRASGTCWQTNKLAIYSEKIVAFKSRIWDPSTYHSFTLKRKVAFSSESVLYAFDSTQCHFPQHRDINMHHRENLRYLLLSGIYNPLWVWAA